MKLRKGFGYFLIILLLTVGTQVGGLVYLIVVLLTKKTRKRLVFFVIAYGLTTFLIVPNLAPFFGRIPVTISDEVKIHAYFTRLTNRHYVTPELNAVLQQAALDMQQYDYGFQLHVLDANFPFWDGFPLLPHLSHNDGKKVDISLQYKTKTGKPTNQKPSRSGYGVFEKPLSSEYNQITQCKEQGYWQYDFPKYLTFGVPHQDLVFDARATQNLLDVLLRNTEVEKLFIEPHLKNRLDIQHSKLRYHGCRAVRHDDHIHVQVK